MLLQNIWLLTIRCEMQGLFLFYYFFCFVFCVVFSKKSGLKKKLQSKYICYVIYYDNVVSFLIKLRKKYLSIGTLHSYIRIRTEKHYCVCRNSNEINYCIHLTFFPLTLIYYDKIIVDANHSLYLKTKSFGFTIPTPRTIQFIQSNHLCMTPQHQLYNMNICIAYSQSHKYRMNISMYYFLFSVFFFYYYFWATGAINLLYLCISMPSYLPIPHSHSHSISHFQRSI